MGIIYKHLVNAISSFLKCRSKGDSQVLGSAFENLNVRILPLKNYMWKFRATQKTNMFHKVELGTWELLCICFPLIKTGFSILIHLG